MNKQITVPVTCPHCKYSVITATFKFPLFKLNKHISIYFGWNVLFELRPRHWQNCQKCPTYRYSCLNCEKYFKIIGCVKNAKFNQILNPELKKTTPEKGGSKR